MTGPADQGSVVPSRFGRPRRDLLKTVAGGAAAVGALAAPYVSNAHAAAGISLKIQSLWIAGNVGQQWANKDKDAARVFKLHLQVKQNPSVAYLTPDDI